MPIEMKEVADAVQGGGIVGGIVAAVTTFGWWMRKERSEKAKTNAEVAASSASASASESQATQIEALTKRVTEQGDALIALSNEISHLKIQLAKMNAGNKGAKILLQTVHLCGECEARYGGIIKEVQQMLDGGTDE